MVDQIYPLKRQLNRANALGTESLFSDLHLSIANCFVSSKICVHSDFDIGFVSFLDGAAPRRTSYVVNISKHVRLARVCSHVDYFNA